MKKFSFLLLTLAIFLSSFKPKEVIAPKFTLIIKNIQSTEATIYVGFYKAENNFPQQGEHAFNKAFTPNKTGEFRVSWEDIETGEYAVAIYQDLDGDEEMKTSMFGYPKEPFAFTQNFKPKMSKPKFEQCKINFSEIENIFEVTLL